MTIKVCYKSYMRNFESNTAMKLTSWMTKIAKSRYKKGNLEDVVAKCTHLSINEWNELHQVLKAHEELFDGTLGQWNLPPKDIKLKEGVTTYHAQPFSVPKLYEESSKKEIDHLVKIRVLQKINESQWAALTFAIQKKMLPNEKVPQIRVVSDFWELNKRTKRNLYLLPKIQDLLMKLEGFQYATSLDLNMGYYHIQLMPNVACLYTIILPWEKYEYVCLPMGIQNAPDIFQEAISELMHDLKCICVYLEDVLCITTGDWNTY